MGILPDRSALVVKATGFINLGFIKRRLPYLIYHICLLVFISYLTPNAHWLHRSSMIRMDSFTVLTSRMGGCCADDAVTRGDQSRRRTSRDVENILDTLQKSEQNLLNYCSRRNFVDVPEDIFDSAGCWFDLELAFWQTYMFIYNHVLLPECESIILVWYYGSKTSQSKPRFRDIRRYV